MKVFVVYYMYTETFCSPYESEWEKREKTILATTNQLRATQACIKHNASADYDKQADIKTYEVETE